MSTVISKWGNSLAVRIPSVVAEQAQLQAGDRLEVRASRHGRITLAVTSNHVDF